MWWLEPGLEPRHEPIDRNVARTQLVCKDGCDGSVLETVTIAPPGRSRRAASRLTTERPLTPV